MTITSASADVIDQLVRKVAGEHLQTEPTSASQPGGIKRVKGQDVRMGIFDGAGPDARVGIADVITGVDGSSMAAGFMQWENAFFPWTLNYDEIDMVLNIGALKSRDLALVEQDMAPLFIDVRSDPGRAADPRTLPGALNIPLTRLPEYADQLPDDRLLVLYCNCPNEVSAITGAHQLLERGQIGRASCRERV